MRSLALLPLFALVAACAQTPERYPSLLPRPIEAQGFSTPEASDTPAENAADPALDRQIAELAGKIDEGSRLFATALADAEAKVAVARGLPPGSDRWLDAQVAMSQLDSLQAPLISAQSELEALAIERGKAGLMPYPTLDAAIANADAKTKAQAERLVTLESALKE